MPRIEYIPPPDHIIDQYAFNVCSRLGDDYLQEEIISGLAQFLKVLCRIQAKAATRQHLTTAIKGGKLKASNAKAPECL